MQQAEVFQETVGNPRVLTIRMEEAELDFNRVVQSIFTFLLTAMRRSTVMSPTSGFVNHSTQRVGGAQLQSPVAKSAASTADDGVATIVARLVAASSRYDVTRNRRKLEDGHLSSQERKRELRGILLNDSKIAAELARYRVRTGYDYAYSAYCSRYGFKHHVELNQDGIAVRRRARF